MLKFILACLEMALQRKKKGSSESRGELRRSGGHSLVGGVEPQDKTNKRGKEVLA